MTAHPSSSEVNQRLTMTDESRSLLPSSSSPSSPPMATSNNDTIDDSKQQSSVDDNNDNSNTKLPLVTPVSKTTLQSQQYDSSSSNNNNNDANPSTSTSTSSMMYEIPKCITLPVEEIKPMETYLINSVRAYEQYTSSSSSTTTTTSSTSPTKSTSSSIDPNHLQGYRLIINSLKRPMDPPLLRKMFIALRTAGHGSVLNQIALLNNHAQLVHLIIRFQSTRKPKILLLEEEQNNNNSNNTTMVDGSENNTGNNNNNTTKTTTANPNEELLQVYNDYTIIDAHMNLLLAMVSAKSTHVVPVMSAIWKLLTRYGPIDDDAM